MGETPLQYGELAEWFIAKLLKSFVGSDVYRGFESHALLHKKPCILSKKYSSRYWLRGLLNKYGALYNAVFA